MSNLLEIRRRGMMKAQQGEVLTLLYQNSAAITTANTDTGVKLFDPVISWTIVCDATCNNYGWNTTSHYEGIFGLSPNSQTFRLGKINQAYKMIDGVIDGSKDNYYYAISMYKSGGTSKCLSISSRHNGAVRRKVAIRYNSTTKKFEGISSTTTTDFSRWYIVDDVPVTSSNVFLLVGGITATIHDIKIYEGLMSNSDMLAYIS